MRFLQLKLENWRNFLGVDVPLEERMFLVGPNASGKSNLLDAFRFLRDVADQQGGFQKAVTGNRRGVSQLRSLYARRQPNIVVEVKVALDDDIWVYHLSFSQDSQRRAIIRREAVIRNRTTILVRPDKFDRTDESRLTQTYLEQLSANKSFRVLQEFFSRTQYLHIVPQLVREPDRSVGRSRDPFGGDFLEQIARTPSKTQKSRLRKIAHALRVAVPQLKEIELSRDERGVPHLRGLHSHWRPKAGWQTEEQFSDGTLRLLGLLWSLLDGAGPLLLEEPELSLHADVIRYLPSMFARLARKSGRQILVSTHSPELLSDPGIEPKEVLMLRPTQEGTEAFVASSDKQIRDLVRGGVTVAEVVIPRTAPRDASQLTLFGD